MRSFEEARTFARELGLQSKNEWNAWTKGDARPSDIPVDPRQVYKENGWIDWGDWLGTNRIATFNMEYRSFQEARAFVRSLGLKGQADWRAWAQSGARPMTSRLLLKEFIKVRVGQVGEIGSELVVLQHSTEAHRPFEEAREFVHGLGLKNQTEWRKWSQSEARPSDIPAYPDGVYKEKGWKNWGDWLGIWSCRSSKSCSIFPFQEARAFVHDPGTVTATSEWKVWAKSGARPDSIPASPTGVYEGKGWVVGVIGWNWAFRLQKYGLSPFR